MKKLIAFSVIFALLASAVFALELGNFAAQVDIRTDLLDTAGTHLGGDFHAGGWDNGNAGTADKQVRFSFSYETSGGEAGISGSVRFDETPALNGMGTGWWKPVDIVKITLGGTRFNRRLDENNIWWDYEQDGSNARGLSSENFIAFEIGPFADMVTLKLGIMGNSTAGTFEAKYVDTFVVQAVFNLGDLGTAAATYDHGTDVLIADYQATFSGFNVKAAFGFRTDNSELWGLSAQVDTNIEGIGLLVRFNTDKFERMQIYGEASYGLTLAELDFGKVTLGPKVSATFDIPGKDLDGVFTLGWEAPLLLTKVIDGFTFETGLRMSGNTTFNDEFKNIFRLRVPFVFKYRF